MILFLFFCVVPFGTGGGVGGGCGDETDYLIKTLSAYQIISMAIIGFQYIFSLLFIIISIRRLREAIEDENISGFIRRRHPHATFALILNIAIYLCVYYQISIFCWNLFYDTCAQTTQDMTIMGFEETILLILIQLIFYRFWMLFFDHKHSLASIDINCLQYMPSMIGSLYDNQFNQDSTTTDDVLQITNTNTQTKKNSSMAALSPTRKAPKSAAPKPSSPLEIAGSVTTTTRRIVEQSDWAKSYFGKHNFF